MGKLCSTNKKKVRKKATVAFFRSPEVVCHKVKSSWQGKLISTTMNIPRKHFQNMVFTGNTDFPHSGQELARIAHLWGEQVENPKHAEEGERKKQTNFSCLNWKPSLKK